MENYKITLKKRTLLLAALVVVSVALGIYDVFFATPEIKQSFIFGFQCGAVTALGVLAAILIIRYRAVLKDETKLRLQFNKENDERQKAIRAKAGIPMILITSVLMIVAGVVAGYFNTIIFATLLLAAMAQLLICCAVKMIYMKIM